MMFGMGKAPNRNRNLRYLTPEQRQQVILERERLQAELARLKAQTTSDVKLGKSAVALLPAQASAEATMADSAATGQFVKALPWIIGGAVALIGLYFVTRKKDGGR